MNNKLFILIFLMLFGGTTYLQITVQGNLLINFIVTASIVILSWGLIFSSTPQNKNKSELFTLKEIRNMHPETFLENEKEIIRQIREGLIK